MNRYVERECTYCEEGRVHLETVHEVRTHACPDCGGTGRIFSYLYPKPKGRRGPWPPEGAAKVRRTDDVS